MAPLNPEFLNKLTDGQREDALTKKGFTFIFNFLFKRGSHCLVIGQTGSGKTQKLYYIANWICRTKETVIWLDSQKEDEFLPLLTFGVPVVFICPKGTSIKLSEWSKDDKKYILMKNHPEIITVPDPGSTWWAIKKDYINILCFRNAFDHDEARLNWMGELFSTLSEWTRKKIMPRIYPFAFFGDEAHWFNAGVRLTNDNQRRQLSDLITEHSLTIRAPGGRLVFATQGLKNLPPAARENFPNNLLCRGTPIEPTESPSLSRFGKYVSYLKPQEGFFVYSDGSIYPKKREWTFPFFDKPKIRVEYIGQFDSSEPFKLAQDEIETEMQPDMSKYQALAQDLEGYKIPATINRYEVIKDE
jgi:energy-coupling factor transporter ATP-binding protein EcfA2